MNQVFDTNETIYKALKASTLLTSELKGDIYVMQRPDNSEVEDIVVNTIALTQEYFPQIGTSNINIHVPDQTVTISDKQQKMPDNMRLKLLAGLVLNAIRGTRLETAKMVVENQTTIKEPDNNTHFVNIRINWIIHE